MQESMSTEQLLEVLTDPKVEGKAIMMTLDDGRCKGAFAFREFVCIEYEDSNDGLKKIKFGDKCEVTDAIYSEFVVPEEDIEDILMWDYNDGFDEMEFNVEIYILGKVIHLLWLGEN